MVAPSIPGWSSIWGVIFVLATGVGSLTTHAELSAASLKDEIESLAKGHLGDVSVSIRHIETGEQYSYRGDVVMPTASLIKFPVMIEAFRQIESGRLSADKLLTLNEDDKVPGAGILTPHFSAGTTISLRDAIHLMIVYSDNTATNLVLGQIGLETVGSTMESLGAPHTKIYAKVYRRETSISAEMSSRFGLGSSTADELVGLFSALESGELISRRAAGQMRAHLSQCDDRTKLARELPPTAELAHKSGSVARARCDAGLLETPTGTIAICVLTANNSDRSYTPNNTADKLIGEIARRTYLHFAGTEESRQEKGVALKSGDGGLQIEYLQRTLNVRSKPSPELDVDGDFGSQTEAAVRGFQTQCGLLPTGVVDVATWKALGPLITQAEPVPDPSVVKAAKLPILPPDTLAGEPFVTCRAWCALDNATGELLKSRNAEQSLDIASTTKIMTAYVVLAAAKADPSVLNEVVTFSTRADQTRGSTAGVAAGESLSVDELLYGLLLPSGNDASIALAEHFGSRLATAQKLAANGDSLDQFVAVMNSTAKTLGLTETNFKNPHGLTAAGHKSSAHDMGRLAWRAYQMPGFSTRVSTRMHGCRVNGPTGYQRNLVWSNTNRLLSTSGYLGIKTGTTSAAGACLVSLAERDGRQILLVTLGSASSDARYTDSRNLFRWLWQVTSDE